MIKKLLTGCLVVALSHTVVALVFAQELDKNSSTLTISPTIQSVILENEQQSASFSVRLVNDSATTLELEVFASDFAQTNANGTINFVNKIDSNASLSEYIQIPQTTLLLAPKSESTIPASVINLETLSPGGHYAAIIVRQKKAEDVKQQQVSPGLSSLIFIQKKGGEIHQLSLQDTSIKQQHFLWNIPQVFTSEFNNTGNTALIPIGTIRWTDNLGRVVSEGLINAGSQYILPNSQRNFFTQLAQREIPLPFMKYEVKIQGDSNSHQTPFEHTSTVYAVFPGTLVLCLLILFGIIVLAISLKKVIAKKRKNLVSLNV